MFESHKTPLTRPMSAMLQTGVEEQMIMQMYVRSRKGLFHNLEPPNWIHE